MAEVREEEAQVTEAPEVSKIRVLSRGTVNGDEV